MTSTPKSPLPATLPSHPAHTLLLKSHTPETATQIFTTKIKNKPLLLTPSGLLNTDKRTLRRNIRARKQQYQHQHRSPRPLSAKEKRSLHIHDLTPSEIKYDIYKGLNTLWTGYILEVLGFVRDGVVVADAQRKVVTQAGHGSLLASADFHGMEVEVVRCVDVGRVGTRGIVVRESKGGLVLVTKGDRRVTVLKRGAVFRVVVLLPHGVQGDGNGQDVVGEPRKLVFDLLGEQLEFRPAERATKKFKWKLMRYL